MVKKDNKQQRKVFLPPKKTQAARTVANTEVNHRGSESLLTLCARRHVSYVTLQPSISTVVCSLTALLFLVIEGLREEMAIRNCSIKALVGKKTGTESCSFMPVAFIS